MFEPLDVIKALEYYTARQAKLEQDRKEVLNSPLPQGLKDEQDVELKSQIEATVNRKIELLSRFAQFPPHHRRHQTLLTDFHTAASFDRSVFIMTKFPDPQSTNPLDMQLARVIKAVQDAVTRCQFTPRVAYDRDYYPSLWDNVELYLLGCRRGIAIVESRYKPELNPNVAMEWGWMRGMGRNVLYLVESTFDQKRADWSGLIEYPFSWDDPERTVPAIVHKWLGCTLQH